jgi:hypothetical protein
MRVVDEAIMSTDRQHMQFPEAVTQVFAFLREQGFQDIESSPTISRYRFGNVTANVFHGRRSYELGFEIGRENEMYAMSELIRASDRDRADRYRNPVATTSAEVVEGLQRLADLVRAYADRALRNDPSFFDLLRQQREAWSEQYALDVLCDQVRLKAEAAFREGRYREAAELYGQIRARLSAVEIKKLQIAMKRS